MAIKDFFKPTWAKIIVTFCLLGMNNLSIFVAHKNPIFTLFLIPFIPLIFFIGGMSDFYWLVALIVMEVIILIVNYFVSCVLIFIGKISYKKFKEMNEETKDNLRG